MVSENLKCKVCGVKNVSKDHINKHTHKEVINFLYSETDKKYRCEMCGLREEKESSIKAHVFKEHDKFERLISMTEDISPGFFA